MQFYVSANDWPNTDKSAGVLYADGSYRYGFYGEAGGLGGFRTRDGYNTFRDGFAGWRPATPEEASLIIQIHLDELKDDPGFTMPSGVSNLGRVQSERPALNGMTVKGRLGTIVRMPDEPEYVYVTSQGWFGKWRVDEIEFSAAPITAKRWVGNSFRIGQYYVEGGDNRVGWWFNGNRWLIQGFGSTNLDAQDEWDRDDSADAPEHLLPEGWNTKPYEELMHG
jgi:hypothetical protein